MGRRPGGPRARRAADAAADRRHAVPVAAAGADGRSRGVAAMADADAGRAKSQQQLGVAVAALVEQRTSLPPTTPAAEGRARMLAGLPPMPTTPAHGARPGPGPDARRRGRFRMSELWQTVLIGAAALCPMPDARARGARVLPRVGPHVRHLRLRHPRRSWASRSLGPALQLRRLDLDGRAHVHRDGGSGGRRRRRRARQTIRADCGPLVEHLAPDGEGASTCATCASPTTHFDDAITAVDVADHALPASLPGHRRRPSGHDEHVWTRSPHWCPGAHGARGRRDAQRGGRDAAIGSRQLSRRSARRSRDVRGAGGNAVGWLHGIDVRSFFSGRSAWRSS